ncbi:MAG: class I SAM-dependent methyltransferase [Planctomycetota bacterium]|jgi:SAM-dependent methyltransferase
MPYESSEGDYATVAHMYDADYALARTPSGDVDFYVEEARRSGGPVAEFGCGTGRVLIPVAEAGLEVVGVDASPEMLARLRARRPDLEVHVGDMRDFDLGRRFPLVTIPFRALSHIGAREDHVVVFENMRRHLTPDGRLVFDVFQPRPDLLVEPHESLDIEREEDGRKIRRYASATPHLASQTSDITLRWEVEDASGAVETLQSSFVMRWFFRFELEHALARAGLAVEALYGRFDRSALADDSPEMIFVAKPGSA